MADEPVLKDAGVTPVEAVIEYGMGEDGQHVVLDLRVADDFRLRLRFSIPVAQNAITALQGAIGLTSFVTGEPATESQEIHRAEVLRTEESPNGREAILVFEGATGRSPRILFPYGAISQFRTELKNIERKLKRLRASPVNRQ